MAKFKNIPSEMVDAANAMIAAIEGIENLRLTREEWQHLDAFKKALNKLPTAPKISFAISVSITGEIYSVELNEETFKVGDYFYESGDRWQITDWVVSDYFDNEMKGELWQWEENLKGFIHLNSEELTVSVGIEQ